MPLKLKAAPPPDSDEESLDLGDHDETASKRIKLIRESRESNSGLRFTGGIVVSLESGSSAHSTSASLSAAEKKGLKEVEELERELDLKNTFSRETNRRDEDAEMNKYIEEQIRLRREAAKREREATKNELGGLQDKSQMADTFALPVSVESTATENVDDILLQTLSKNYSSTIDEKSESMLSSQMLNGIPEVDLGLNERIRTIEATEEAKLRLVSGSSRERSHHSARKSSTVPTNFACNFQSHRGSRDRNEGELKSSNGQGRSSHNHQRNQKAETKVEPVVSVGAAPREIELRVPSSGTGDRKPPAKGRASDDYYLQKYKKNNRR